MLHNTYTMKNFDELASQESIEKVVTNLKAHHIDAVVVDSGKEAHAKILTLIPNGASVMNGSSRTLEQIGFVDHLKSDDHQWNNQHAAIVAEADPAKQGQLRQQALLSDYYLGSVHAVTEEGEFVVASNTGSQLPHIAYSSANVVLVVGTQKIVASIDEAFKRINEYVIPLEDENMQQKYGVGTQLNKMLVFKAENPMYGRKVTMILVKEKLGF